VPNRPEVVRQEAVAELARQALEELELQSLLDATVDVVAAVLQVSHAAVLRLDPALACLTCRAQVGWRPESIRPVPLERTSQVGLTFLDQRSTAVEDYATDERFPASRHLAAAGIASGVTVPIRGRAEPVGVLACHHVARRVFDGDELAFMRSVAGLLAAAAARIEADRQRAAASARLQRLHALTAALAGAHTEQEVVEAILGEGLAASGARDGLIGLVDGDHVVVRAAVGYPSDLIERWQRFPLAGSFPISEVARTGEAVYCANESQRDTRWPSLAGLNPRPSHGFVALPLLGRAAPLGGLALAFAGERAFSADDRELLETIARQSGQALERARAQEARTIATERLEFLAEASRVLASSLDVDATLRQVAELAVPRIADWYIVVLREGDSLRQVAVVHSDPEQVAWASRLDDRYGPRLGDEVGVARVIRSGVSLLVPDVTDEMLVGAARDERHLEILRELGMRSVMIVPLATPRGVLGTISFVAAESNRRFDAETLALAEDLAGRAAIAIENSLLHRAERQRANAAFVLDRVADGVFELARDGTVRLWNEAAANLTGIPAAEAAGRSIDALLGGWPAAAARIDVSPSPGTLRERQALPFDIRGEERWLELAGVDHGDGVVYAFRDITHARELEEAQRDFLATASHELRTPVSAVYGAAQTIARRALDGPTRAALLDVILSESQRLTRIVNDLLLANTLDAGKPHLELEPLSPAELVRELVEARSPSVPAAIALRVDLDGTAHVAVAGDRHRLQQVLANLLDNAIKYSPDGGTVTVAARARSGVVEFSVADEGLGIPFGEQERIFEKFHRLDPQLTRGVGGTGLGLYICRELVRRMGGRISVTSRTGVGSTFTVELPAGDGSAPLVESSGAAGGAR
jgi:PAS domain S-box-containing protein